MKKIYLLTAVLIAFSSLVRSQCTISGETSPTCENDAVQTLTTTGDFLQGPGITGNTFDPAAAGVGTHTIEAVSTSSYTIDQTGMYAPATLNTPTAVSLTDDDLSAALPIGFNFNFFGTSYNQFYISSNGFISFSVEPNGCCTGQALPDANAPNNLIAFAWEDIDPGNGGQPTQNLVQYETLGTAPNRILVVEFFNVDHYATGDQITVQTILYESSNIIEVHTTDMPSDGGNHTQGIENAAGTVAFTVPGRNSANWSATNDFVAFIPDNVCASTTIEVNATTTGTDVQTACDSYTWIDGNTYTSNNNSATFTLTNAAGCDSVVTLDLTINNSTTGTDVQTACDSYTWIDGNTYTSNNNSATFTLTNAAGCDSVVTLDLTIDTVNIVVTNNSPTLVAEDTSGTYQWVNCDDSYSPIAGETDASYTAIANGNYAVILTQNGCTDTSACEIIDNVGLNNKYLADEIIVSPNPSSGQFSVTSSVMIQKITVIDNMGRIVNTFNVNDLKTLVELSEFAKGSYIITITTSQGVTTKNVIKH